MAVIKTIPDAGRLSVDGADAGGTPQVLVYIQHRERAGSQLILTTAEALDLAAKIPAAIKQAEQAVADNKRFR